MNTTSTNGTWLPCRQAHTQSFTPTQGYVRVRYSAANAFSLANVSLIGESQDTVVTILPTRIAYRYGFQGQEKDDEIKGSGNSYDFGARMYDPRIGRWLTIDPLSEKYPHLSTYNFVANSPLQFVDPNGKEIIIYDKNMKKVATVTRYGTIVEKGMENSDILKSYNETKEYFKGKDEGLFERIESDDRTMTIFEADNLFKESPHFSPRSKVTLNGEPGDLNFISPSVLYDKDAKIELGCDFGAIIWNSNIGAIDAEGNNHSPAMIFYHELIHADEYLKDPKQALKDGITEVPAFDDKSEEIAINKSNEMSKKLANGDGGNGEDKKRTSHGLKEIIETSGPTSNEKKP